jgi:hypothetical protein
MKALRFRQPWAELVLQGRKTLDLRTYPTHYRGPLAIHASKTVEREACLKHRLDPDALPTGGIVGVVELVEIIPLTQVDYDARQAEHLAGRSYRDGMYGWVLRRPQRLPHLVPAEGRMSLFNVELRPEQVGLAVTDPVEQGIASPDRREVEPPAAARPLPARPLAPKLKDIQGITHRSRGAANGQQAADTPFELLLKTIAPSGDSPSLTHYYSLTLRQRIVQPPQAQQSFYGSEPATMTDIVTLSGDSLRAVSDHVLDSLREAGYKATDLSPSRRAPFHLPEAVGVRLGLVFLAVKPLSKLDRIEAISHGIRQMTAEELYYWYSKCTAADTAERAQKALRILLAGE